MGPPLSIGLQVEAMGLLHMWPGRAQSFLVLKPLSEECVLLQLHTKGTCSLSVLRERMGTGTKTTTGSMVPGCLHFNMRRQQLLILLQVRFRSPLKMHIL